MQPYFFLSYARGDDDGYTETFFRDLSAEIRMLAGLRPGEPVGFYDGHRLQLGSSWSRELVDAVSTCRTFIALCSPRYFYSEACGKEWAIFADRMRRWGEPPPPALLPVSWLPLRHVPAVAATAQYQSPSTDAYDRRGLRQLMRLQRNRDDYLAFVAVLAQKVVETAHNYELPRSRSGVSFDQVVSTFHRPVTELADAPGDPVAQRPVRRGSPDVVQFAVVASTREEASALRADTTRYGERAVDWAPYLPAVATPIARLAQATAVERDLLSNVLEGPGFVDQVADTGRRDQVVVVLLDPWAVRLEAYRRALARWDEYHHPAAALLVPVDSHDDETRGAFAALSEELRAILPNLARRGDDLKFRSFVLSREAFQADLLVILEVARNRLFATGTVHPRLLDRDHMRPILEGP